MANEFEIHGLDGVLKKMRTLGPKLKKKGLRSAGTKAMRIVRDAARRGTARWDDPETSTNISKKVVTRYDAKGSRRVGGAVTKVGVAGGAKVTRHPDNTGHWRHKEFGTSKMPADPVLRASLANNVGSVTSTYVASLNSDIDKIIAKGTP